MEEQVAELEKSVGGPAPITNIQGGGSITLSPQHYLLV